MPTHLNMRVRTSNLFEMSADYNFFFFFIWKENYSVTITKFQINYILQKYWYGSLKFLRALIVLAVGSKADSETVESLR